MKIKQELEIFNGQNYLEWQASTELYFMAKGYMKVITDLKLKDGESYEDKGYLEKVKKVAEKNTEALGTLGMLVSKDYKNTVLGMKNVAQAWEFFQTFYAPGGTKKKLELSQRQNFIQ